MKESSPSLKKNFFKTMAANKIMAIEKIYQRNVTNQPALGKIRLARRDIIGSLALQGIKGTSIAVISFSFGFSTVLAVIIPGTEQPVPTIKGIMDLPDKLASRKPFSVKESKAIESERSFSIKSERFH